MNQEQLLTLAREAGFSASFTTPDQVLINPDFRSFCEENRCGKYNANYSCPPDCGTVEELHEKLLSEDIVMVVQTIKENVDKTDKEQIIKIRTAHNAAILRLMKKFKELGYSGFCAGYSGCSLCNPCKRVTNEPCTYPELRISCMSAYCVDVANLAEKCNLEFSWEPDKLFLFGMLAFHK